MNVDKRRAAPRVRISLELAVSLLLGGTIVAVGAVVAIHDYRQTSRIVLEAADDVFRRMGRRSRLSSVAAPHPSKRWSTSILNNASAKRPRSMTGSHNFRRLPRRCARIRL